MQILSANDYQTMPWKNGGGVTNQLAVSSDLHPFDSLPLWRLSIATVATDGPFSLFEHYQRCIMLLQGAGMRLKFGQQDWISIERPLQRQLFSGAWQTDCELIDGEIRDFNLMVDQRRAVFESNVIQCTDSALVLSQFSETESNEGFWLLYVISGDIRLQLNQSDSYPLSESQTAIGISTKSDPSVSAVQIGSQKPDATLFVAHILPLD